MLHPDTELRVVSADIGFGVFATALIPKGTIVYIKDPLEIEIGASNPQAAAFIVFARITIGNYSF